MPNNNTMSCNADLISAIEIYFKALYYCDLDMFDQVFHLGSSLFDADEGATTVVPIAEYRGVISKRVSPARQGQDREDEVIMIDWLSVDCATVKVRLRIHENVFVDHLSFVRGQGEWRIVAKLWHLEEVKI